VPRDRLTFRPTPRRQFEPTNAALATYQETYLKANDGRLATAQTFAAGGAFSARLTIPGDTRGDCHVRVFVTSDRDYAHAATPLRIASPSQP
jgi:hypothetical protein